MNSFQGAVLSEFANAHKILASTMPGGWYYRGGAPSAYQPTSSPANLTTGTPRPIPPGKPWQRQLGALPARRRRPVGEGLQGEDRGGCFYAAHLAHPLCPPGGPGNGTVNWLCKVTDDQKTFPWTDKSFRREDSLYLRGPRGHGPGGGQGWHLSGVCGPGAAPE